MKKYILLFLIIFIGNLFAEVEPNNTYLQANTLGPNSSDSGSLSDGTQSTNDPEDWFKITIPSDGALFFNATTSTGFDLDLYIYDINGSTNIASGSRYGTYEYVYYAALKAGTYYLRVYRYSGSGTYTLNSKFTAAPYTNDTESNDTYQTATTFALNSTTYGHIKYYQNGSTDWDDWYKFVIPADGSVSFSSESDSADVDLYLYDVNGTTSIATGSTYGLKEQVQHTNLMPGTYYLRIYGYSSHGGYKITSTYTQTNYNGTQTNDSEKNDSYSTAVNYFNFTNAGSSSNYGHLGFYTNGYTDWDDWWVVNTTTDGKLIMKAESNTTLDVDLYLYDINGTTQIGSSSTYGSVETLTFNNLAAGKYYIRTYKYSGYGSYKISADFTVPSLANDTENNDEATKAISINTGTKMTGHLGYYTNSNTDYSDYYTFTLSAKWDSLYIRMDSETTLDAELYLYNSTTGSYIAYSSTYGAKEILKYPGIPAGTYYIRVYKYSGQGAYAIKITSTYPTTPLTDVKRGGAFEVPTSFELSQNYPNPFNPTTTIYYQIPTASKVSLKVFDLLGKEVAELVNEEKSPGYYTVKFNAAGIASGVYIYKLTAGGFTSTKKLLLLK